MARARQVKNLLIRFGLHKALKGRPTATFGENSARSKVSKSIVSDEDWEELDLEELDLKAASTIRLCLVKNILTKV